MITLLFYAFYIGYFLIFALLFNLDLNSFDQFGFYMLVLGDLIIGFILSIISILAFTSILGEFRQNKPFDNKFNHKFANSLLRLATHILRIKVVATGLEHIPEGNFVYVSNHQENYDIIVTMPLFKDHPITFIGKKVLFDAPVIGKWMTCLGNIPISRYADREAVTAILTGIKRYKSGLPMAIYPEGKRSFSNKMIEFKPGALKLATKPKADILIGTIFDLSKVFKSFPWRRYVVKVHFQPILKYDDYKELNTIQLAAKIKAIMQIQLDKFEEAR